MDNLELKIIEELQSNYRQSNMVIAHKLGVSESTIRRRIARMVKNNSIRFTVVIEPLHRDYQLLTYVFSSPEKVECR